MFNRKRIKELEEQVSQYNRIVGEYRNAIHQPGESYYPVGSPLVWLSMKTETLTKQKADKEFEMKVLKVINAEAGQAGKADNGETDVCKSTIPDATGNSTEDLKKTEGTKKKWVTPYMSPEMLRNAYNYPEKL